MRDERRSGVKAGLTASRQNGRSAALHRHTDDVADGVVRLIRAIGNRAAGEDEDSLVALQRLENELTLAWRTAITGQRRSGITDREIGEALGVSKQAVHQRWPREDVGP